MSRRPMTGSEGRDSVEQTTANIAGRGYDQLDSGSSNVSTGGFAVRSWTRDSDARLRQGPMAESADNRSPSIRRWESTNSAHTVIVRTTLSNIRITTFFAGESEVKIVDLSRVREVQPFGCEGQFIPPMEC